MKKAYSYIRYSSPQQANGDSFRRQLATTQDFCNKNNYELDHELSIYQELGVSGFKGDQENLRRFVDDCEAGKVKKGSLLIVENLDRLSRQKINVAMRQFLHLLEYVDIYTLQDNKKYSHTDDNSGDNQLLDIMTSLIIMSRAYEESATKQKRLKESWKNKRANIHTKKLTSLIPHWLELSEDKTTFYIKKDRVEIIKYIYQECISGIGVSQLLRYLNNNLDIYPAPTTKSSLWARTSLSRILTDRSVLGEYQQHIGSHPNRSPLGDPVLDYYPQIIDEDTYLKAQIARKNRIVGRGKIGKENFSNLYRGLLKCGFCDGKVEYVDKGNNPSRGGKYLTCSNSKRGGKCSHSKHYKYLPLELMLLHLTTENGFMPKPEAPAELKLRLAKLQGLNQNANNKLNILLDGNFTALPVQNKISELSTDIDKYSSEIKKIEDKILTFRPDYNYDDLYKDVILENDKLKLFSNRINFNSYLFKKIDYAYLIYNFCPFIIFKMKDGGLHTIILDDKYNFGGCSLPNNKDTHKRLNGKAALIDEKIWETQNFFLDLVSSSENIQFEDNKYENILKRLNKLISKLISTQDIEIFDLILIQIKKAHNILSSCQKILESSEG
ncbi:recombinase family protein [Shewanella frigidimarina]|uniref:recombinase family protein n=1 Tax=Shewanella frigidimarina TaxID=56812 RepID=UPI003D794819